MGRAACTRRERSSRLSLRPRHPAGPAPSPSIRGCLSCIPRAGARLALAALLLAAGTLGFAQAASADTLVSNLGQTADSGADFFHKFNATYDIEFTTGYNTGGYRVEDVKLRVVRTGTGGITVSIRETGASPQSWSLTTPSLSTIGDKTFSHSSGITLAAGTTYVLRVTLTGGDGVLEFRATSSDAEDGSSASGWSIADQATQNGLARSPSLMMSINGEALSSLVFSPESVADGAVDVDEGGTATYKVALDRAPSSNVTVSIASSDTGAATVNPSSLTFTTSNWATAQEVTVAGVEDADKVQEAVTLTHSATGVKTGTVVVTVRDDEAPPSGLVFSATKLDVREGGTATYKVRLAAAPKGRTFTMPGGRTVYPSTGVMIYGKRSTAKPGYLKFDTTNWNVEQMVTLTAHHDVNGVDETGVPVTHAVRVDVDGGIWVHDISLKLDIEDDDDDCPGPIPLVVDPFWEACLTIGTSSGKIGYGSGYGSLSDKTFAFAGTNYTIEAVYVSGGRMYLDLDTAASAAHRKRWIFSYKAAASGATGVGDSTGTQIGGDAYDSSAYRLHIPSPAPADWTNGRKIRVALRAHGYQPPSQQSPGDAPGAPAVAAEAGDGAVTLTWTAPEYAGTLTGWEVRHGEAGTDGADPAWGAWTGIADATADTAEHTVTGLDNGTAYAFELRAMVGELAGEASAAVTATPAAPAPPGPPELQAEAGDGEVTLLLLPPAYEGTLTGWEFRYGETGDGDTPAWGAWTAVEAALTESLEHTVTGLDNGTSYSFEARARAGSAAGAASAAVAATPAEPLDADLTGSVPDGAVRQSVDGCRVEVAVRFTDEDGEAEAVDALSASDFTVENGRVGTPVADDDGLAWTVPAWATAGFTGLMRVRLAATERWQAAEQAFRVSGGDSCAPAAPNELASLSLDGLALAPAFAPATTAYTAAANVDDAHTTVSAAAVYGTAQVAIAPADADAEADGHQVALAEGASTDITVTVTPSDTGVAAQGYTVTVTRAAAADPDGTRAGAVSLGAQSPAKGRQFFRGKSLDRANGDRVDYYTFTTDGRYALGLGVRDQSVELAVTLEDADGTTVGTAGPPKDPNKDQLHIEWLQQAIDAGTYYIRVEALADGATDYYLRFGLKDAPAPAQPAVTDPDGTRAGAVSLGEQSPEKGRQFFRGYSLDRANGDRVDYYTFTTDGRYALGLGVRDQSVELEVVLEDANGTTVGTAGPPKDPSKDQLHIEWLAQTIDAGTYYIRVEALADGATDYYLRFGLAAPPPELSVADASVAEGPGAALDFAVTLDKAWSKTVTVAYATADGTAAAGDDYTATNGTLTFAAGETAKTVPVPVLDDAHDEGSETLTLRLSNPQGAVIADGAATGTITNDDPVPEAWLARFGRTVTGQVLAAVEQRLSAPRQAGAEMALAGQALPSWRADGFAVTGGDAASDNAAAAAERAGAEDRAALASMTAWLARTDPDGRDTPGFGVRGADPGPRLETRSPTGRDFITGTSFALTGGASQGGFASLWGRGSIAGFDGREGSLTVDGEVTTGLIGADWAAANWTAGLALGHSTGAGGWRQGGGCDEGKGDSCAGAIDATLSGLYPYAGMDLTDRLTLWAAAGHGSGEVTVTPEGGAGLTADLTMSMGAAGVRSEVLRPGPDGGLALALKGDARVTRASSDAVGGAGGNLEASAADVWLARLGLEGSRRFVLGGDMDDGSSSLTPSFEVALRLDGGDAETGLGADLGGGLAFADPANGLALDLRARGLVAHAAPGFQEWGASLSGSWDPRPETDRGLALTLRQSWGASPAGGMDALLSRDTLADLAANDDGTGRFHASSRLEGEVGYGLALPGGVVAATPNVGFARSGGGARDWRVGWRVTPAVPSGAIGLEVSLDAARHEPAGDGPPEQEVTLRAAIRW